MVRLNIGNTAREKYGQASQPFLGTKPVRLPFSQPREIGYRDGERGTPNRDMVNSHSYREGYANGGTWRHADRIVLDHFTCFDLCYRPRDPHCEPTVWLA